MSSFLITLRRSVLINIIRPAFCLTVNYDRMGSSSAVDVNVL